MKVWVHTLTHLATDILGVDLRPMPGESLPAFTAGAHIDVHLSNGMVRSYSLSNDPKESHRYVLGVLKDPQSRGGSSHLHQHWRIGQTLEISAPRNHFELNLAEAVAHTVLVAGGIGITPLLSMARTLQGLGRSYEMIYCGKRREAMAFLDDIQGLVPNLHVHADDEQGAFPDLPALFKQRGWSESTHLYACGPGPFLDAFLSACDQVGLAHAHIERFSAQPVKASEDAQSTYELVLQRSGQTLTVEPNQRLLDAIRLAGVEVITSCEEGICGSCETRVLSGEPDHRDSVLTAAERASNQVMMVCVSGCKSPRLVLDA
jgi:ferredoxin-NADP reductase